MSSGPFDRLFVVIGLVWALGHLLRFAFFLWRHLVRPLVQAGTWTKYGDKNGGSWAVVTGGSDGIGLAVCHKLAKEGFNICIVSRSEEKIKEKLKELEQKINKPTFKTKCIVADFSKLKDIEEYNTQIAQQLVGLDVAILVLNAGMGFLGPLIDLTNSEVERLQQINCNHVVYTAKTVLPLMAQRYEQKRLRSAIVCLSSIQASRPLSGGCVIYSGAKQFVSILAEGLSFELQKSVDVISYQPAGVVTKMISYAQSFFNISSARAAECCFRDLGCDQMTRGDYRHELLMLVIDNLPLPVFQAAGF